jgi:N-acetylglucosaminyl-diphospho-decaprenol L-rhamnosyltransferase
MELSIIIINWHSCEYVKQCIASIMANTSSVTYEILVFDSGSFDGCEQMLRDNYPGVRFIQGPSNVGFARANNCAFEHTTGRCVLFLNPDTELVGPAIDTLYSHVVRLPTAGAVGGKLLNSDRTVQTTCIRAMPTILNRVLDCEWLKLRLPLSGLWGTAPLYTSGTKATEVEAISGACLMIKRDVFEQVERFTEEYFMYAEDMDLSHKLAVAGFKRYYIPNAVVVHYGGTSSNASGQAFSAVMIPEATFRFFRRTRGPAYARWYRLSMCGVALGRLAALGGTAPIWLLTGRRMMCRAAVRKWMAVLRWSLGNHELVKRHYSSRCNAGAA